MDRKTELTEITEREFDKIVFDGAEVNEPRSLDVFSITELESLLDNPNLSQWTRDWVWNEWEARMRPVHKAENF